MIKTAVWSGLLLLAGALSVSAQLPPPGASDNGPMDRNIKNRSNELERVKRESKKSGKKNQASGPTDEAARFEEIKKDFEQIQLSQDEVIKAYTTDKEIDYGKIARSAEQFNASATRLKGNLFPAVEGNEPKDEKKDADLSVEVKTLIVEIDNALAAFVGNALFTSPQTAKAEDRTRAQNDLEKLIRLSAALKKEAGKTAK